MSVNDYKSNLISTQAPYKPLVMLDRGEARRPVMPMRRTRHAKIVATLGPASSSPEMIRALFEAGADVFRFNFSHGSHEEHQTRYDIVRAIERETGRPIAVLADLQGPKLRIGRLADGPIR